MILRKGFKSFAEAKREALKTVQQNSPSPRKRATEVYKEERGGGALEYAYTQDNETGATAYTYFVSEGRYEFMYLTAEENERSNRTYPYRYVTEYNIAVLASLRVPFFRPKEEIPLEELLTPHALRTVDQYLGEDISEPTYVCAFMDEEETGAHRSTDKAFYDYDDDGIQPLRCKPYPALLTKLTGVEITSPQSYANGIQKLLGVKLTASQRRGAKEEYVCSASNALARYALYEFVRTESYDRLKEVLGSYEAVPIPQQWGTYPLYTGIEKNGRVYTIEEAILSKYISEESAKLLRVQSNIPDIADHTGAPIALLRRAKEITTRELL